MPGGVPIDVESPCGGGPEQGRVLSPRSVHVSRTGPAQTTLFRTRLCIPDAMMTHAGRRAVVGRNEHILVVDDEAEVRDLLYEYLTKQGHQVSTAEDVSAARA